MIFKRILINNFGGLREKDIGLTSGVNVLYGLKETEMNIVFIFVKSMFFGVPEDMQEKNGIYEKAGTCVSREEIKKSFWPTDDNANEKIDAHIKSIRKVLKEFQEYKLITVRGKGYYLRIP